MQCPHCQHENRQTAKFCAACGHVFAVVCAACGTQNSPGAACCDNCGTRLARPTPAPPSVNPQGREPLSYTPRHLVEKILTSRSALEGERKQVTVLFADLRDSTELIKDLDPEAAQQLLDPAIHRMMEAVHRFKGTVSQVLTLDGALQETTPALLALLDALPADSPFLTLDPPQRRQRTLDALKRVLLRESQVLPLLQAIADLPEEVLHRHLAHFQEAEFLYETRLFPERAYTFKHALAEELDMRPLVAHCHLGLGTLHAKPDRRELACAELSTAIDLFRSMEMIFWLSQSEAALAQLD